MVDLAERITVDPERCGGRPCIRGMRIRVSDVLDLLANGLTPDQVIEELPDLEPEDIQACLRFVSRRIGHPVLAAPSKGEFSGALFLRARWNEVLAAIPREVLLE